MTKVKIESNLYDRARSAAEAAGGNWSEMLMHPRETPFAPDSVVQSIEIDYPQRAAWTSGSDYWLIYWFVASMVAALCIRPLLRVNI